MDVSIVTKGKVASKKITPDYGVIVRKNSSFKKHLILKESSEYQNDLDICIFEDLVILYKLLQSQMKNESMDGQTRIDYKWYNYLFLTLLINLKPYSFHSKSLQAKIQLLN